MIDRGQQSARRFEETKRAIDLQFPAKQFVAVENDRVVADASSHHELVAVLRGQGKTPKNMLIVQAGVKYPESAVIFIANMAAMRTRFGCVHSLTEAAL